VRNDVALDLSGLIGEVIVVEDRLAGVGNIARGVVAGLKRAFGR